MTAKILIVDDDALDRAAIARELQRPGQEIEIIEATMCSEGLDLLLQNYFDCVFIDYLLPDMDGIQFVKKACVQNDDIPPPMIILTGQGHEGVVSDAIRAGAVDYLSKDNLSRDTLMTAYTKAREIYELKKHNQETEKQLLQSRKMEAVGQLTAGLAHDFSNILSVILGGIRPLTREITNELHLKKLHAIETAAQKGAAQVKRLMTFSRQHVVAPETFNMNEQITDTLEMLQQTLGSPIIIETDFAKDLWAVHTDPGQFDTSLINLAINARDAMPNGGTLRFETRNVTIGDGRLVAKSPDMIPGDYILFSISDTGCGMSEETRRRAFEPYYTTKDKDEGSGFGLSMAYGFIKESGGHIFVSSEEGNGTTFRIYLPKAAQENNENVRMPQERYA